MSRKYSIDILRIISAIAVVIIHVVSAPLANSATNVNIDIKFTMELIHVLMNWSVPVFFMITGYCVLGKSECTYKYCFKHVWKYVATLFTVGFFYAFLEQFFIVRTVTAAMLFTSLLHVVSGELWAHMWFVYAIIGVYLVLPVVHSFIQQGKGNAFILTGLLFAFTILCPTFERWLPIGITFPIGGYMFYVCFGGIVANYKLEQPLIHGCYFMTVISLIWIALCSEYFAFGYLHIATCFVAVGVFLFVSNLDIKPNKMILKVSQCTWGVYLIHPFFINIALKVLYVDLFSNMAYGRLFIFGVVILFVSFVVTYMLRQIPYVKKLF